jgi:hypothetical protein
MNCDQWTKNVSDKIKTCELTSPEVELIAKALLIFLEQGSVTTSLSTRQQMILDDLGETFARRVPIDYDDKHNRRISELEIGLRTLLSVTIVPEDISGRRMVEIARAALEHRYVNEDKV